MRRDRSTQPGPSWFPWSALLAAASLAAAVAGFFNLTLIVTRSFLSQSLAPGDPLVMIAAFIYSGVVSAITFAVAGPGAHRLWRVFAVALFVGLAGAWVLLQTVGSMDRTGRTAAVLYYGAIPMSVVVASFTTLLARMAPKRARIAAKVAASVAGAIFLVVGCITVMAWAVNLS